MSLVYTDSIHPADAIRMGIEHEKEAIRFYEKAAKSTEDPGTKNMFKNLAEQEVQHLKILEDELDKGVYTEN